MVLEWECPHQLNLNWPGYVWIRLLRKAAQVHFSSFNTQVSNPKWSQQGSDQLVDLAVDQLISADQRVWQQWSSRADCDIMKPSPNPSASVAISSWEEKMRIWKGWGDPVHPYEPWSPWLIQKMRTPLRPRTLVLWGRWRDGDRATPSACASPLTVSYHEIAHA